MEIALTSAEIVLQDNQPVSLRAAKGVSVTCTRGVIWITVAGHLEDIFLAPGESHRLDNNRLTLIESIGHGGIRLTTPRRRSLMQSVCVASATLFDFDGCATPEFAASLAK